MKKNSIKTQQKNKRSPQNTPKYINSFNSTQNVRSYNFLKDNQSPQRVQNEPKQPGKKTQFWKNIIKPNNEQKKKQATYILSSKQETKEDQPKIIKPIKKQLRQTMKSDESEYKKLHDKLNYLQGKISDMNITMDKKHQQKFLFLQNQKKERIKRLQSNSTEQSSSKNKLKESFRQYVTQVNQEKEYIPAAFNPYSPRHNIYYVSEIIKFYKDEKSSIREHIVTSAQYFKIFSSRKIPSNEEVISKTLKLSRKSSNLEKKTVVFDLDETLIHCNDTLDLPHDVRIKIVFPNGDRIDAGINIRPYAVELLKNLSKNFQIIVFTASHSCYANVVLDYLDPNNEYIHHRLFREHCHITSDGVHVKDLRIINRDLSQMILIDNAAYSYAYQIDNGIPILPYFKGKNDFQLKALQTYIQSMMFQKDVRELNKKTFKLQRYQEFNNIDNLVKTLYGDYV